MIVEKMNFRKVCHGEYFKKKRRGLKLQIEVFSDGKYFAAFVYRGEEDPNIVSVESKCREVAINDAIDMYIEKSLPK